MKNKKPIDACPCGRGSYSTCCEPLHLGTPAVTAEDLMRSRYSAYVLKLEPYLLATWHRDTRPDTLDLARDAAQWIGLDVKRHAADGPDNAIVEFVARYRINSRAQRLHEISRFARDNGLWFYIDGNFPE